MKFIAFFVMNRLKSVVLTAILSAFCLGAAAQTPTNVEVTGAVQQASVNRFGVNLGRPELLGFWPDDEEPDLPESWF